MLVPLWKQCSFFSTTVYNTDYTSRPACSGLNIPTVSQPSSNHICYRIFVLNLLASKFNCTTNVCFLLHGANVKTQNRQEMEDLFVYLCHYHRENNFPPT